MSRQTVELSGEPLASALPLASSKRRLRERLELLPRDVGFSMWALGAAGMVIPGPVPMGGVLVAVGTFFVWPRLLDRWGEPLARRFPRLYNGLSFPVERFQNDLERRYPGVTGRPRRRLTGSSTATPSKSVLPTSEESTMEPTLDQSNPGTQATGDLPSDVIEFEYRLKHLPPEVGTLLVIVGIAGILLPGPVGSPFLLAGGVALWPRAFERVEHWYAKRFPKSHRSGMRVINRFILDLEKRYPGYGSVDRL
ncbi:MAG TPA: hypothetical protein VFI31_12945 [Pirellulales bacterium]|nr:hypothetical protein [Pirellulales bacterium]